MAEAPGLSMFIVHDTVARSFNRHVFLDRHPAPVCRTFFELLANKNTAVGTHPADFNLVHIGFIDDEDGTLTPIVPIIVATGASWLAAQTPAPATDA